jgi:hypothetical protein
MSRSGTFRPAPSPAPRRSWLVRDRFVVYATLLALALALILASRHALGSAAASPRRAAASDTNGDD